MYEVETVVEGFRLSAQQKHVWQIQQQWLAERSEIEGSEASPFLTSCVVEIEGEVHEGQLRSAVRDVIARHDILHSRFISLSGMTMPVQTAIEDAEDESDTSVRPIDWRLIKSPEGARLELSQSALCGDRMGLRNVVREIARTYEARLKDQELDDEPMQYVVVSEWLNELLESEDTEIGRDYWRRQDLSALNEVRLPYETNDAPFDPQFVEEMLSPEITAQVLRLAEQSQTSLSSLLFSCLYMLLRRMTGRHEIILGNYFDGRTDEELQTAPGLFARCLPIRCDFAESISFIDLVKQLHEQLVETSQWQECFTWEQVTGGFSEQVSYIPYSYEHVEEAGAIEESGLRWHIVREASVNERYVVKLESRCEAGQLRLALHYDGARIRAAEAKELGEYLQTMVAGVSQAPQQALRSFEMVGAAERERQLESWGRRRGGYEAGQCLGALVGAELGRRSELVAVRSEAAELSYRELEERTNQVAHYLRAQGVGPEVRVGILLERSAWLVEVLLGVLKGGGCYVPLDPQYPQERLQYMVQDAGLQVLLTEERLRARAVELSAGLDARVVVAEELREQLSETATAGAPESGVGPGNLAYVIYTSGSTGKPKGVMVSHQAIVNRLLWMREAIGWGVQERVLLKTSISFDASIWELFMPLLVGGSVVVARAGGEKESGYLSAVIEREQVTTLQLVPSLLRVFVEEEGIEQQCRSLRRVFCGGEGLPAELVQRLQEKLGVEVYNLYGPTEGAIDATWWAVGTGNGHGNGKGHGPGLVALGEPLTNVEVLVLDQWQRLVPGGVGGEIYLGGMGLARGYWGRGELTGERFVPHPYGAAGARLYRTGDLGHWDSEGRLHYLGRMDQQVKVRGYRIELEEVETALRGQAGVSEAVVVAQQEAGQAARLVAYVVGRQRAKKNGVKGPGGEALYRLPNGLEIAQLNKNETDILYQEIFADEGYLQHGIELGTDACVFDIGANIGLFTLHVHARCAGAVVYAFEPIPTTYAVLQRNMELYELNTRAFNCGVGRASGRAEFTFYPRVSASSGMYADAAEEEQVTRAFVANQGGELAAYTDELMAGRFASERYECELRTVSEVIRSEGVERIDLLKVDVEKAELDVLEGIAEEDWGKIKQVVLEVHDRDGRLAQVTDLLRRHGFNFVIDQYKPFENTGLYNIFAVHPSRKEIRNGSSNGHNQTNSEMLLMPMPTASELRAALSEQLPEYMIPSTFIFLDSLPHMPNGKVDRRALPAATPQRSEGERIGPATPVEEVLVAVWGEVLRQPQLSRHDNFFELGGHSLIATQVMSRLRRIFHVEVPLRLLFEAPTVAGLGRAIERLLRGGGEVEAPPLVRASRGGELPLSYAQQRLWFLEQMEPGNAYYNIPVAVRLRGTLEVGALERSFAEVVRRHEALRTRFREVGGQAVQEVMPWEAGLLRVAVEDLSGLSATEQEAEIARQAKSAAGQGFDLREVPLLRVRLLRLGAEEYVLILTMHHIVSDGWSVGVLVEEVGKLYEGYVSGAESPLAELGIQYGDYAVWQREWLQGAVLAEQVEYWREQLRGAPGVLELPTDRPRPKVQSYRGAREVVRLERELTERLQELSRGEGATLFMTLLAAFKVLLSRYTGQKNIVVGTDVANRNHIEIEKLIGFFINQLALNTNLEGDPSFSELLERVRDVTLGAYAHQDLPFEKIVEVLNPERNLDHAPIFQVKLAFQNIPLPSVSLPRLEISGLNFYFGRAKLDLTIFAEETEKGLILLWEYNSDLFESSTIKRMMDTLERLLRAFAAHPEFRLSEVLASIADIEADSLQAKRKQLEKSKLEKFKSIKPKAFNRQQSDLVRTSSLRAGQKLPLVFEPEVDRLNVVEWTRSQREFLEQKLYEHGALLFRGFKGDLETDFEPFALNLCFELFNENGEHPREPISGSVYTPVFYPPEKQLLWHNENSFNYQWPTKILFGCLRPAAQGGETPLVDSRKVFERIDPDIREFFVRKGIIYVRNYGEGLGLDWPTVFGTTSRTQVEEICRRTGTQFEWTDGNKLRTRAWRPAVVKHPATGEMVWFNQAQHWHPSCLDSSTREALLNLFSEEELPRNCYYGDGSKIEDSAMESILEIYNELQVVFPWQVNDVLVLDNLLTAHGRNPFVGERKLLVTMGDMRNYEQIQ